jgi:hypothetical protein
VNSRIRVIKDLAFAFSEIIGFEIPSSLSEIGKTVFLGCNALDSVVFGAESNLLELPGHVIERCAVRIVWFPDSFEVLRRNSLTSCKRLENVTFNGHSQLKRIEKYVFSDCDLYSFCIPESVEFVHPLAFDSCRISLLEVDTRSPYLSMFKKFITTKDQTRLIRYFGHKSLIEIPKEVIEIGDFCFNKCIMLESVRFESGSHLKIIGKRAFQGTFIRTISIPASVECIKKKCFADCTALSSIKFEAGIPPKQIAN